MTLLGEAAERPVQVVVPAGHAAVDVPSQQLGNPLHYAVRVDPFSIVGGTFGANMPHIASVATRMMDAKETQMIQRLLSGITFKRYP